MFKERGKVIVKERDYWDHGIRLKENKHSERNLQESHHHQVHQILYVLEHTGVITFNKEKHVFSQDSLVFIPPYAEHAITSETKMTVLVLEFDLAKLDADIQDILKKLHFNQATLFKLNRFTAANVRQLLRRMLYEQSRGDEINALVVKNHLEELLLILVRSEKEPTITGANELRAERLREYIDTHYFEIRSADDISQKLGISTRHMNAIYKERYERTPTNYLNEVRMEIAKKLLMETDHDIASICFEVGFEAISTFYRKFKNYTNMSPYQYRIKYQ